MAEQTPPSQSASESESIPQPPQPSTSSPPPPSSTESADDPVTAAIKQAQQQQDAPGQHDPEQQRFVELARTLPERLQTFLARYPPASILPQSAFNSSATSTSNTSNTPSSSIANAGTAWHGPPGGHTLYQRERPNPFEWWKNPETGRWREPVYSMRRQAQLVRMARAHGVAELLPPSRRDPEVKLRRRVEFGLKVRGTGVGQVVKGHKHERQLEEKMEKRRIAVEGMQKLVKEWRMNVDGLISRFGE